MKYNKADQEFSRYIRLRDSDEMGHVVCCTCGKVVFWKDADCGHFRKRRHLPTRWLETNAHAQCKECNQGKDGAHVEYCHFLNRKYGPGIVLKLSQISQYKDKYTQVEVDNIAKMYKQKADELLKSKRC